MAAALDAAHLVFAKEILSIVYQKDKEMATTSQDPPEDIKEAPHPMYNPRAHSVLPSNPKEASALLRSYIPDVANPITAQLSYGKRAIPNLVFIRAYMRFPFIDQSSCRFEI